jgi:hypothetical protein
MTEKISLTSYMRTLLLEEICSRMNIIEYCNQAFGLKLHHFKGSCYKGKCPYCRQKNVSFLHGKTGHFSCPHCRKASDFFHLVGVFRNCDLNGSLAYISDYLEKAEELELACAGGVL